MATSMGKQSVAVRFLAFAIIAGLIGGFFSVMIRAELAHPGMQFFANGEVYNVFVTQHVFLLICFSLLPTLFFGFGEIALGLRAEGTGSLSGRIANTILALLVLAFIALLSSALIEYDIRGRNGVGGGWTVYAPLSTTGKPGNIFSFLSLGMDLGLLALLLVLAAVLLGALRYYSVLFFHVGAIPKGHAPLAWSVALAFFGALLLMPYHVYIIFLGGTNLGDTADPVYTKILFGIMETSYTSLLFIIALGLASTIALSGQTQSGILVKGMVFLVSVYAGLEIFSLGWVSFCQNRVLGCQSIAPYQGWIVGAKVLSAVLLFLLWIVASLKNRFLFRLPNLWLFPVMLFYLIGIFPVLYGLVNKLRTLDYGNGYETGQAHFLGGVSISFVLFAGLYYFYPRLTGKPFARGLAFLHLVLMSVGVSLTFVVQKFIPMPRRIADYPEMFEKWNYVSSVGSYLSALGLLCFLILLIIGLRSQREGLLSK